MYKAITSALTPSNKNPKSTQSERADLNSSIVSLSNKYGRLEPFLNAVYFINKNLMSHDNHRLSKGKAKQYITLTSAVSSGEKSNSYAFAASVYGWVREGFTNPAGRQEAMVGAEMNVGGALLSSAVDHQKRSKGLFT